MFNIRSAILTKEQKEVIKHALFLLQKDYYLKCGELPPSKRKLIDEIATALNLRVDS
ncbi:hypothetical protein SSZBM1_40 [Synechococcus phage S-SZBM1]|uniref:Uncharacterized protein n=1 Tax=Synechococcus phage S-SZBM1 TaxID=2926475 RepID=A0AC61TSE4_9CAUD|nr:hypothetical protein PP650_gp040 [Synechococcus phage S-SZBM1]UNH61157.1 hypothetical protein SSZBM1_40 [Synechococcus phage S-SZBM1]